MLASAGRLQRVQKPTHSPTSSFQGSQVEGRQPCALRLTNPKQRPAPVTQAAESKLADVVWQRSGSQSQRDGGRGGERGAGREKEEEGTQRQSGTRDKDRDRQGREKSTWRCKQKEEPGEAEKQKVEWSSGPASGGSGISTVWLLAPPSPLWTQWSHWQHGHKMVPPALVQIPGSP